MEIGRNGKGCREKYLLDKGDGLATAAGARRNDEVTNQNVSKYIQIHEGSLVRHTHTHTHTHT